MSQTATMRSLPRAFRMMKAMHSQGIEWGEDYRRAAGAALRDVLEGGMAADIVAGIEFPNPRAASRAEIREVIERAFAGEAPSS